MAKVLVTPDGRLSLAYHDLSDLSSKMVDQLRQEVKDLDLSHNRLTYPFI